MTVDTQTVYAASNGTTATNPLGSASITSSSGTADLTQITGLAPNYSLPTGGFEAQGTQATINLPGYGSGGVVYGPDDTYLETITVTGINANGDPYSTQVTPTLVNGQIVFPVGCVTCAFTLNFSGTNSSNTNSGDAPPPPPPPPQITQQLPTLERNARFISWVNPPPTTMQPGETRNVEVYMRNTGDIHWEKDKASLQQWNQDAGTGQSPVWQVGKTGTNDTALGYMVKSDAGPLKTNYGAMSTLGVQLPNKYAAVTNFNGYPGHSLYGYSEIVIVNTNGQVVTPTELVIYKNCYDSDGWYSCNESSPSDLNKLIDGNPSTGLMTPGNGIEGLSFVLNFPSTQVSAIYAYPMIYRYSRSSTVNPLYNNSAVLPQYWGIINDGYGSFCTNPTQGEGTMYCSSLLAGRQGRNLYQVGGNWVRYEPMYADTRDAETAHPGSPAGFRPGFQRVTGTVAEDNSGNHGRFQFSITAPTAPGNYKFQWRMHNDEAGSTGFFGEPTPAIDVTVSGASLPTVRLYVSPQDSNLAPGTANSPWASSITVLRNDPAYLRWITGNSPDSCSASSSTGSWSGSKPVGDNRIQLPASDTASVGTKTYTITCTKGGVASQPSTVTINVIPPPFCTAAIGDSQFVSCAGNIPAASAMPPSLNDPAIDLTVTGPTDPAVALSSPAPVTATPINRNFGGGGPVAGVNADRFMVRWVGEFNFPNGSYVFTSSSDDGAAVFLYDRTDPTNRQTVITDWSDHGFGTMVSSAAIPLNGKKVVEYWFYENGGGAQAYLNWSPVIAPNPDLKLTGWIYNNTDGPAMMYQNAPYTLSWGPVTQATSCTLDGVAITGGEITNGGSRGGYTANGFVNQTRTHTLSCTGPGGTVADNLVVQYPPDPTNLVGSCSANGTTGTISWNAPASYTNFYIRAFDHANGWNGCSGTDICNEDYSGTSYSFTTVPGHTYSWWIHTRSNPSGASSGGVGPAAGPFTCPNPPPPAVSSFNATVTSCEQVTLNWTDIAGETEYRIYRNTINNPGTATLIATKSANETSHVDNGMSAGTYYYWIASYGSGGESSRTPLPGSGSVTVVSCSANLEGDKDIVGKNAITLNPAPCDGYQAPTSIESFQIGDTVRFRIAMCNSSVYQSATDIQIVDTLTNLGPLDPAQANHPTNGWNMSVSSGSISSVSYNAASSALTINYSGSVPVAPSPSNFGVVTLTFDAKITAPANMTGNLGRFQNRAVIRYKLRPSDPTRTGQKTVQTGLVYFFASRLDPDIVEVAPR